MRGTRFVLLVGLLAGLGSAASAETALRDAIEGFVRRHAPEPPTSVEVPPLADFAVPEAVARAGSLDYRLSAHPRERFEGRVPVSVAIVSGDRELKRGVVTVRVRMERQVLVAARSLRRGETLGADDVRVETRDASELPEGWLAAGTALTGQRVRRSLRAGQALADGWIEAAPLVVRGEAVRLELERGSLRIEARGEARADGYDGDWIRVVNRDSGRELTGRVAGEGVVRVAY